MAVLHDFLGGKNAKILSELLFLKEPFLVLNVKDKLLMCFFKGKKRLARRKAAFTLKCVSISNLQGRGGALILFPFFFESISVKYWLKLTFKVVYRLESLL